MHWSIYREVGSTGLGRSVYATWSSCRLAAGMGRLVAALAALSTALHVTREIWVYFDTLENVKIRHKSMFLTTFASKNAENKVRFGILE